MDSTQNRKWLEWAESRDRAAMVVGIVNAQFIFKFNLKGSFIEPEWRQHGFVNLISCGKKKINCYGRVALWCLLTQNMRLSALGFFFTNYGRLCMCVFVWIYIRCFLIFSNPTEKYKHVNRNHWETAQIGQKYIYFLHCGMCIFSIITTWLIGINCYN